MGDCNMKLTKEVIQDLIKQVISENKKSSMILTTKKDLVAQEGKKFFSLQKLNETTMTAIQGKYMENGFVVLTSDRSCHAELGLPYGEPCPEKEEYYFQQNNIENREILKRWIRSKGYGYTPVYGGFKEEIKDEEGNVIGKVDSPHPEHALLVMARNENDSTNHLALKEFAKEICEVFNQDAFFYKPPNSETTDAYFINRDGKIDETFKNFVFGDLKQDYFTQLAKGREKLQPKKRFTALQAGNAIPEALYVPKPPLSAVEARERRGEIFITLRGK